MKCFLTLACALALCIPSTVVALDSNAWQDASYPLNMDSCLYRLEVDRTNVNPEYSKRFYLYPSGAVSEASSDYLHFSLIVPQSSGHNAGHDRANEWIEWVGSSSHSFRNVMRDGNYIPGSARVTASLTESRILYYFNYDSTSIGYPRVSQNSITRQGISLKQNCEDVDEKIDTLEDQVINWLVMVINWAHASFAQK